MKKKIISVIAIMSLVFGTCAVAMADGTTAANATRNSLKSSGNVVYTDGENSVEIYSEDLYMIADRLDLFKNAIADQLATQDTYFTSADKGIELTSNSNVNIVHTAPSEGEAVDPLTLDFDSILEGIAASQSIPSDVSEYGYPEGTTLYKTKSGELTTDGTEENAEQINIAAARPENLSAGSAAWVNGELILGTGSDNNAYYNSNSGIESLNDYFKVTTKDYSFTTESDCDVLLHAANIYVSKTKPAPTITLTINGKQISSPISTLVSDSASQNLNGTAHGVARSSIWIIHLNKGDNVNITCRYNSANNGGCYISGYIL